MLRNYLFVILAFILALSYLFIETFIHVYIFRISGDYGTHLFLASSQEWWMRLILISVLISFGVFVQLVINSRRKAIDDLQAANVKVKELLNQSTLYRNLLIHDITNIFQNIKSAVELIFLQSDEKIYEHEFSELLVLINDQIKRGIYLAKNVHVLTQFEERKEEFTKIDVLKVLKEIVVQFKENYKYENIEISIQASNNQYNIMANELLSRVFENLLTNAIKHNENVKKEITITISTQDIENVKYVKLQFKDNGVGIKDEYKESIFDGITRRLNGRSGMGIGLSLVKKLVHSYDGYIKVQDRISGDSSQGSDFIILIPEVIESHEWIGTSYQI